MSSNDPVYLSHKKKKRKGNENKKKYITKKEFNGRQLKYLN
jgi:hypothetical protein